MKALVSLGNRMVLTPDRQLWTRNGSIGYSFWTRYLDVYDEVRILVRAASEDGPPEGWVQATGSQVHAAPVPDFGSPVDLVKNYSVVTQVIRAYLREEQAVHLRVPDLLGELVARLLEKKRPFGVEVVGDPHDVFAPGNYRHPLRPLFHWWFPFQLRHICKQACAAAYVTEKKLQSRYPPSSGAFTTHYSSIELGEDAFADAPRTYSAPGEAPRLVSVGSLDQLYKAPDVLIDAVEECVRHGSPLRLTWIGEGKHRSDMVERIRQKDLASYIQFIGQLPTPVQVRAELDQADLFVLPSRTEGLPKAMIEAMARALPCIGSTAGGTVELLPPEDTVSPGDAKELSEKISEVLSDPQRMSQMSKRNLAKAREYREEVLRRRRTEFYRTVCAKTVLWFENKASA